MKKRIVSFVIAVAMAMSISVPTNAESAKTDASSSSVSGMDLNVNGEGSLGSMLEDSLSPEIDKRDSDYAVMSVEMQGKTASVLLQAAESSTLVVGLYDDAGHQLLASSYCDITDENRWVSTDFDLEELPEYYLLRAYIVDKDTKRPLSEEYICTTYTRAMQMFLQKTTDDFDSDRVINFDEDKTNNFSVIKEGAIIKNEANGANVLASSDEETGTYTFENADAELLALQEGDVLVYGSLNPEELHETLMLTISAVSVSGSKITVTGSTGSIDDYFEYFRIDMMTQPEAVPEQAAYDDRAIDISTGKIPMVHQEVSVGIIDVAYGKISFGAGAAIKLYYSIDWDWNKLGLDQNIYTDFQLDYEAEISLNIGVAKDFSVDIANFTIVSLYKLLNIAVTVEVTIYAKGAVIYYANVSGSITLHYDSNGKSFIECSKPIFTLGKKLTVEVGLTFNIKPNVNFWDDDILSISINGEISLKAIVEKDIIKHVINRDEPEKHLCKNCWDGDVVFSIENYCSIETPKRTLFRRDYGMPFELKLLDFYYSEDFDEFAMSECPHKIVSCTFLISDMKGNSLENAVINIISGYDRIGSATTNDHGLAFCDLPYGKYNAEIICDNYKTYKTKLNVGSNDMSYSFMLTIDDGSEDDPGYGYPNTGICHEITVRVEDSSGNPIEFAFVQSEYDTAPAVTNDEGIAHIGLPEGEHTVTVSKHKYQKKTVTMNAESGEITVTLYGVDEEAPFDPSQEPVNPITDFEYTIENNQATITNYVGTDSTVIIPEYITDNGVDYPVTNIDSFGHNVDIVEYICVPKSVTKIGINAFTRSPVNILKQVDGLDNVTEIGYGAFYNCEFLTSVGSLENVISIGDRAFSWCESLATVGSLKNVISIGNEAFEGCKSLATVGSLESVRDIGHDAFSDCESLESITLPATINSLGISVFQGCSKLQNVVLPEGAECTNNLFNMCTELKSVSLPSTLTIIDDGAFACCFALESIKIPQGTLKIGNSAFYDCNSLNSIEMPESILEIGEEAFRDCDSLNAIVIPNGVIRIGPSAFYRCSNLESIYIPPSVTECCEFDNATIDGTLTIYGESGSYIEQFCNDKGYRFVAGPIPSTVSVTADYLSGASAANTLNSAEFTGLRPNEVYNFYIMKDRNSADPFGTDNLWYISQHTSDDSGNLTAYYRLSAEQTNADMFVVRMLLDDISGATVTLDDPNYNGETQIVAPVVEYNSEVLTPGTDYYLSGDFSVCEAGEYSVTVNGTGLYKGSVSKEFEVIPQTTSIPVISPNGGKFTASVEVTITCDTEGAEIYYTTDGTAPTTESTKYEGAFELTKTATVKAIAVKSGFTDSEIALATFDVTPAVVEQACTPVITPNGGEFTNSVEVIITCDTEGAEIYYTTDGTAPTAASTKYEGAFELTKTATVKAIAVKSGFADSEIASAAFEVTPAVVEQVGTPVISPNGGEFTNSVEVTITCGTEGAEIYYTTDGTAPTTASTKYEGTFELTETATVKAIAVKDGMENSSVVSAEFTKNTSPTPPINPGRPSRPSRPTEPTNPHNPIVDGVELSWAEIAEQIHNLPVGGKLTVDLNGNTTVPANDIVEIANKDAVITFVLNTEISFVVDGAKISGKVSATDLAVGASKTALSATNFSVIGGTAEKQITLGSIDIPAKMSFALNKANVGKFASLMKLNSASGKYDFVSVAKIAADGKTLVDINGKGDYLLIIDSETKKPGDLNNDIITNALDAAEILKSIVNEISLNSFKADYNGDGASNAMDASEILNVVVGLVPDKYDLFA